MEKINTRPNGNEKIRSEDTDINLTFAALKATQNYDLPQNKPTPLSWPKVIEPELTVSEPTPSNRRIASPHDIRVNDVHEEDVFRGNPLTKNNVVTDPWLAAKLSGDLSLVDNTQSEKKALPVRPPKTKPSLLSKIKNLFK